MSSSRRPWPRILVSIHFLRYQDFEYGCYTGWCDKVEQDVDAIVPKSWVSLDSALLCENVIVLPLKIVADLCEARFVVHAITESWGIDDGQGHASTFLIKFKLNSERLDLDTRLASALVVQVWRLFGIKMREDSLLAEGVDEGSSASTRGAADHQAELDTLLHILLTAQLRAGNLVGRHSDVL